MSKEFTSSSGSKIVIDSAPWKDAKALKKAMQKEAAASGEALKLDADVGTLLSLFLKVDGSDAVDAALWPCLIRCTRNGEKITEQTFDDPEARKDYYEIVLECAKVNLGPLAENLASKFSAALALAQKPKAENNPAL